MKWTSGEDVTRLASTLRHKAENFPLAEGRQMLQALWLKAPAAECPGDVTVFSPADVMSG